MSSRPNIKLKCKKLDTSTSIRNAPNIKSLSKIKSVNKSNYSTINDKEVSDSNSKRYNKDTNYPIAQFKPKTPNNFIEKKLLSSLRDNINDRPNIKFKSIQSDKNAVTTKPVQLETSFENDVSIPINIFDMKEEPPNDFDIFNATVYLNLSSTNLNETVKKISQTVMFSNSQFENELKELPEIIGLVDYNTFENVLDIYENNQTYYCNKLNGLNTSMEEYSVIIHELTQLEKWFGLIIEPLPDDEEDIYDWRRRESNKIKNGYTIYCDISLQNLIKPFDDLTKDRILKYSI